MQKEKWSGKKTNNCNAEIDSTLQLYLYLAVKST